MTEENRHKINYFAERMLDMRLRQNSDLINMMLEDSNLEVKINPRNPYYPLRDPLIIQQKQL